MGDNLGAGQPRRGPSHVAADLVDRRIGLVAADWQSSCLGVDEDADAMLRVFALVLQECGGNTRGGHVHPTAASHFNEARHLFEQLDVGAITGLREVVRRQVLLDLPPQDALAALHCASATLDELHRLVASWSSERLQRLAYVDELTGLGHRRAALETSPTFVANAVRHGRPLVAVVVDVDGLKSVNDGQGHDAGDELLRSLADAFRSGLREGDTAYRTGGDEFLLLLPETTRADAEVVLARVRDAGAPSFSYGTAEAPDEAMTADDLVRLADQRLLEGRRLARAGRAAPTVPTDGASLGRFLAGAGLLVAALAAVLAMRSYASGFDLRDAAIVSGVGILVALLAAAAQSGRRSPAVATVLAPLLGLAAASAAVPMLDGETRPSERIEHVAQPTTLGTSGRPAIAEVPTGTTTQDPTGPSWFATTSTTTPARPPLLLPALPVQAAGVVLPPPPTTTATTTAPTTTPPPTTPPTTAASAAPAGTAVTTSPTTTTPPARAVAVDDDVATDRRNLFVDVLANDWGQGTTLDPRTLAIVTQPASGTVIARDDGTVQFKGADDGGARFEYQICAENRTCDRAWVTIVRGDQPGRAER